MVALQHHRARLVFCSTIAIILFFTQLPVTATAQTTTQTIILPFSAQVEVTVNNAITNQCNGNFGIHLPNDETIFSGYNNLRGESKVIGEFAKDTELVFFITPSSFCSGYKYLSNNTSHAKVYNVASGIWRLEWEDLPDNWPPDNDFDDLIITVRLIGAYPDFKQNRGIWASDIYANNDNLQDNIAKYGCALTTLANLLVYYGARDTNPGSLNTWMKDNDGYDNKNGVIWGAIKHYRPQGSDVAVIDWVKNINRSSPRFSEDIVDSLSKNWPVVLRLDAPESPSGIHFVVAIRIEQKPGDKLNYVVKDPLINNRTESEYFTTLPTDDLRIVSASLYKPADGIARPAIVVIGHSPIEMLLTDNQGRRLGYDLPSGAYHNDIPTGYYAHEGAYWTPNDPSINSNTGERLVLEAGTLSGNYSLIVYGTGEGDYEIETSFLDGQKFISTSEISGSISLGTTVSYNVQAYPGRTTIQKARTLSLSSPAMNVGINKLTSITVRLLDGSNKPIINKTIRLSASLGEIADTAVTNRNGEATINFAAGKVAGFSSIVAEVDGLKSALQISIYGPVNLPLITR